MIWTPNDVECALNTICQSLQVAKEIPADAMLAVRIDCGHVVLDAEEAIVQIARQVSELHAIVQNYKAAASVQHFSVIECV